MLIKYESQGNIYYEFIWRYICLYYTLQSIFSPKSLLLLFFLIFFVQPIWLRGYYTCIFVYYKCTSLIWSPWVRQERYKGFPPWYGSEMIPNAIHDLSVRTGSNQADINQFRSHTVKYCYYLVNFSVLHIISAYITYLFV